MKGSDILTLADSIKATRNIKGITQIEMAETLGVNQAFVSQIENGVRIPNVAMLERIADTLDCSIDGLLGRDAKYIKNERND